MVILFILEISLQILKIEKLNLLPFLYYKIVLLLINELVMHTVYHQLLFVLVSLISHLPYASILQAKYAFLSPKRTKMSDAFYFFATPSVSAL